MSDQQSVEEVLFIGSQDDNYSDGVHISTESQNSNYMTEPQTLAQTPDVLQKISPIIQEKVDKFEIDEIKRKADESPELSKKEKKKAKSREKSQRQKESKF